MMGDRRVGCGQDPALQLEPRTEPRGFVVVLPEPTSANDLWQPVIRRGRTGKQYAALVKSTVYKNWIERAGRVFMIPPRPSYTPGPVAVSIVMVPSTTKRDVDNCIKAVLDLLVTHGLIDGDTVKTVRRLDVKVWPKLRELPIKPGQMQVRIRSLPDTK